MNDHPSYTASSSLTQVKFTAINGGDDANPVFSGTNTVISSSIYESETYAERNSIIFIDYFDQLPLDTNDYVEDKNFSRIDADMLAVVTNNAARSLVLDRREWESERSVITATGFINSQSSVQGGIVYREMMR